MTTPESLTARAEQPVYFEAGGETVFGIFTRPERAPKGIAVILLQGADYITALNRNRLWVRLARRLAARGYHVLRLDYHGVGESTGVVDYFELERPFTEDVEAAVAWIRRQGINSFAIVGVCFGASTALSCGGRIEGVRAIVACAHPVHHLEMLQELGTVGYLRRILQTEGVNGVLARSRRMKSYRTFLAGRLKSARRGAGAGRSRRVSPLLVAQLARVVDLQIPTMFVYGTEDGYHERFEAAREGALGDVLDRANGTVEVTLLEGPMHELTALGVQDAFMALAESWLGRHLEPSPPDVATGVLAVGGRRR